MSIKLKQLTDQQASQNQPYIFINTREVLAKHAATLLWGQGYHFTSDNPAIQKALDKLIENNRLNELFYMNERLLSEYGRTIITLDRLNNGEVRLALTEPHLHSRIGKVYIDEKNAVIRKRIKHDDRHYIVKEFYDEMYVERQIYDEANTIQTLGHLTKLKNDELLPKKEKHGLGVLPLVEFTNLPKYIAFNQGETFNYRQLADDHACGNLIHLHNHIFLQLWKELIIEKSKLIGNFNNAEMERFKNNQSDFAELLGDFILQAPSATTAQGNKLIEIMKGDPKLKAYYESVKDNINIYWELSGYSPKDDSTAQTTEAETLFTKSLDIGTTKIKRELRTTQVMRLADRYLAILGLYNIGDERNYAFEIVENVIAGELQLTQGLIQQIDAGLISRLEAIAKLRGIKVKEAQDILEKIDQERDQEQEKQMSMILEAKDDQDPFTQETEKESDKTPLTDQDKDNTPNG